MNERKLHPITRLEAVKKIQSLIGEDLRSLADSYGITVFAKNGKFNKGWAGRTIEHFLGIGANSIQAPNGEGWELKVVPLKVNRKGFHAPKETMAITMINPEDVSKTDFEHSHLLYKLRSLIICARLFVDREESNSTLVSVGTFDLVSGAVRDKVKNDYNLTQKVIREQGFLALSGSMGELVQPRTKGQGHGSTSRAFYARAKFVARILNLNISED